MACFLGWCPGSLLSGGSLLAQNRVVISEIMYHPVEEASFDANGEPMLDLSHDVHEYIELHNYGDTAVSLAGWSLKGGIEYTFPAQASLTPGGYLVAAQDPDRLLAVAAYPRPAASVFGPWQGQLDNKGDTVSLNNAAGEPVDSVTYAPGFPWPSGANALGAGEDWLGGSRTNYQYRGRSLERVSFTWSANDPANWVASPLPGEPSPGRPNAASREVPKPVVIGLYAGQAAGGNRVVRKDQTVRIQALFSATNGLANVRLEYFLDDLEKTNETTTLLPMLPADNPQEGRYSVTLPGQPDRTLVRYRLRAERGDGDEVVSPRSDDAFGWHAYFVSPVRGGLPSYDILISSRSLSTLATNIAGGAVANNRPRASWDATEPAVFVADGVVYDVRVRYHGSMYLRSAVRKSYHLAFPRYRTFQGRSTLLLSDKDLITQAGHAIFREAGLPIPLTTWVSLYLNKQAALRRLQMDTYDELTMARYLREQRAQGVPQTRDGTGDLYKSQGAMGTSMGPYGPGNGTRLLSLSSWTAAQRYRYTYGLAFRDWMGHHPLTNMINSMWLARSNRTSVPRTNEIADLRRFIAEQWDVDKMLTYASLINWMAAWDDDFHNYFLWRQADERWALLPWDFDALMSTSGSTMGFANPPSAGNYFKQSLMAAYRDEYRRRAWWLNNTLLQADHLATLGVSNSIKTFAVSRRKTVNTQAALGVFTQPIRPVNLTLTNFAPASPLSWLRASPYSHSTNPPPAHAATTWTIRHAAGTYYEPAFLETRLADLESLPLPANGLTLGETYYWRCTYVDSQGHPSIPSLETAFVYGKPEAQPGGLLLNEVMARNRAAVANGGKYPDWVELYNPGSEDKELTGYCLTPNLAYPTRFPFPPGVTIPAHGYLVVWCDQESAAPGLHTGFALSASGETLALFAPSTNGLVLQDLVAFGLQLTDLSLGRSPDGGTNWTLNVPTPRASNQAQPLGSQARLKINEWMANPATGDPWFELYNEDTLPVSLGGLYFTDDLANPTRQPIQGYSYIGARDFVEIRADGAVNSGADHTAFRLRPQGGLLGLFAPDGTACDWVFCGAQAPGVSSGRLPDGSDWIYSLGSAATPGRSNVLDGDGDGMPDFWENLYSLNPYDPTDADADADGDGSTNLAEYLAGTDPQAASSSLRLTASVIEESGGKSVVLRFLAAAGRSYTIEACDTSDAYAWRKLTDIPAQAESREVVVKDDAGSGTSARFYRLQTP